MSPPPLPKVNTSCHPKKWRILLTLSMCIGCVLGGLIGALALQNWWTGPMRKLARIATEIHDYDSGPSFTGDGYRCIRARCSEESFHSYARSRDLALSSDGKIPKSCPIWSMCAASWWNPPMKCKFLYYTYKPGSSRELLGYANGCVYYDIANW